MYFFSRSTWDRGEDNLHLRSIYGLYMRKPNLGPTLECNAESLEQGAGDHSKEVPMAPDGFFKGF